MTVAAKNAMRTTPRERVLLAVEAMTSCGLSKRDAAERYDVKLKTLDARIRDIKKKSRGAKVANERGQELSKRQVDLLVADECMRLKEEGVVLTKDSVCDCYQVCTTYTYTHAIESSHDLFGLLVAICRSVVAT